MNSNNHLQTFQKDHFLYYSQIRLPREESVFFYAILESLEGACFYSTVDPEYKGHKLREISLFTTPELKNDVFELLQSMEDDLQMNITAPVAIPDSFDLKTTH